MARSARLRSRNRRRRAAGLFLPPAAAWYVTFFGYHFFARPGEKMIPRGQEICMRNIQWSLPIGAWPDQDGVRFRVWAASAGQVDVVLYDSERETGLFALAPEAGGYFAGHVAGIGP